MSELELKTPLAQTAKQTSEPSDYDSTVEYTSEQPSKVVLPDGREMDIDPETFDDAMKDEPQTSYTESNPDGTCTPQQYTEQLRWRVGNCGHALDVVKGNITDKSDTATWIELKNAVAAAKKLGDPYVLVDITKELEKVVADFVFQHNFSQEDYQRVSNKF